MTRLSEQQRLALRERFNQAWRERPLIEDVKETAWAVVVVMAETHPATFQRRRRVK